MPTHEPLMNGCSSIQILQASTAVERRPWNLLMVSCSWLMMNST